MPRRAVGSSGRTSGDGSVLLGVPFEKKRRLTLLSAVSAHLALHVTLLCAALSAAPIPGSRSSRARGRVARGRPGRPDHGDELGARVGALGQRGVRAAGQARGGARDPCHSVSQRSSDANTPCFSPVLRPSRPITTTRPIIMSCPFVRPQRRRRRQQLYGGTRGL